MPDQSQFPQRFLDKIEIRKTTLPTPCWLWTACIQNERAIYQAPGRKKVYAHRWAFELVNGWAPNGRTHHLHHRCDQKACVNPSHLTVLTVKEHRHVHGLSGMGKIHAAKTHCARGHEFTPENTYFWRNQRKCRACRVEDTRNFAIRHPDYRQRRRAG